MKAEPKKTRRTPFWLTRAMAEDFTREDVLSTTFREAIIYLIFVIVVTIATIGRRSTSMYYLTQAIKGQFLETTFETTNGMLIDYSGIKTPADFWMYCESLLMDSLYWEHYYNPYDPTNIGKTSKDDNKILFENKLLGVPRFRQLRVKNDSCVIHEYFRRLFLTCYDLYSKTQKETRPFGKMKGTAWRFNSEKQTKSDTYTGKISRYDGSGFYQDLSDNKNDTLKIIIDLKENLWITRGTRVIFLDFSVYNANLNLFAICKFVFEFPPTGGIITSNAVNVVQLIPYVINWDYVTFGCEIAVYTLVAFYVLEEIREIIYFKLRYFTQFWAYMDVVIIALAVGNMLTSLIVLPNVEDAINEIKKYPHNYGNLEFLGNMKILHNTIAAVLLFFTGVKTFKYLNFNKTMGQLNNTLKRCAWDIMGFAIMFFIIFFAFAELGYLLFGSQVEDFRSFPDSMFTLLRTILGDFDYPAIERVNRILAPIYFLSYIFLVFFVLLNMFLAIINDTYSDVKTEIAIAPDEMQMTGFLKRGLFKCLRKMGCKIKAAEGEKSQLNSTIKQIREALSKCGFTDLEIEMFFARYNIDPLAEVGTYDAAKLMRELEAQSSLGDRDDDGTFVKLDDFIEQQERLEAIERTVKNLAAKIDMLIQKLDALDKFKRGQQ